MVTRSNSIRFCRVVNRQGMSSWQKIVSSRWWYPALLLLSFALLKRTLTLNTSSLLGSSSNSNFTCANYSDPVKRDRDVLTMNTSENAAQDGVLPMLPEEERYMWYAPHDGFDKQVLQLVTALKVAMLLNRTLIVPPIFEEGEVVMGDCLESQVTPQELRQLAWSAVVERIADSRYSYVSAADIIDLRSVSPSKVKTIDMRVFLALWCGIDVSAACSAEGQNCYNFTEAIHPWESLGSCIERFLPRERSCLVYKIDASCKTTIWTNSENRSSRDFWEQMLENTILEQHGLLPERSTDEQYDDHFIKRRSVVKSLGPGSAAGEYSLLSFGSLSPQPFEKLSLLADIRPTPGDEVMEQAFLAIDALPYTEEIMRGTRYILELLGLTSRPFFCAHLDLGNVRQGKERVLTALRSRLETLLQDSRRSRGKVNLFLVTDLLSEIWNEKYLGDIADNGTFYEIHTFDGYEDSLLDTAYKMMTHEYGLRSGYIPPYRTVASSVDDIHSNSGSRKLELPPDIRACVEEVVCSCASLGFYGTFPSAVSTRIVNLRKAQVCPI
ncbi:hypothetical protein Mapa_012625 [Marchantia paleacea]|nr:hypothetical protein Mapa_012625 [Marchantia paleacea]